MSHNAALTDLAQDLEASDLPLVRGLRKLLEDRFLSPAARRPVVELAGAHGVAQHALEELSLLVGRVVARQRPAAGEAEVVQPRPLGRRVREEDLAGLEVVDDERMEREELALVIDVDVLGGRKALGPSETWPSCLPVAVAAGWDVP